MSQNTDYCQLATAVVSSSSTNNNTRTIFVPTSSEFSTIHNESFTPSSRMPPIVTDFCVGGQYGVRNASTTMKIKENESANDNHKYSFTLSEKRNFLNNSMSEDSNRTVKSQFYTLDITAKDEETLHSPTNTQLSDNHQDIDILSDAGTYILDDDDDDDEPEQKLNSSSSSAFKRYGNQKKHRHGTFDIHGLISSTAHTINRPVVDSNIPKKILSLSSSSSNSSLHSFNGGDTISENKSSLQQQSIPPYKQIKPAEAFDISPTFETKSFPITNASRQKVEPPWKSKLAAKSLSTKDSNLKSSTAQSNSTEKFSFHPQKQTSSLKTSTRPHTATNDQSLSFQRNSQNQRQTSLLTIDNTETTPNLTKVYGNKSFVLRQQSSNLAPSTSKPSSRQPLKSLPSTASSINNIDNQTNRAVELRRARAQAKIEELSQRKKKQFHKPNPSIDIMSASWHSNASSTNKKDFPNLRPKAKTNVPPKQEDLSATRTISSALHHRSSSVSPNPLGERRDEQQQKMTRSTYNIDDEERCDSLRNNGQRLAIKLIQLSSGILEKLKPNDDVSVRELEQLVDKLQKINRTLSSIDASLASSANNDPFV